LLIILILFISGFGYSQSITQILLDKGIVDTNGCGFVGEPYIYSGECSIGINRYISRSATMGAQLAKFNNTGACWGSYCPEAYATSIQMLIDLKIQLVSITTATISNEFKLGEIQYNII